MAKEGYHRISWGAAYKNWQTKWLQIIRWSTGLILAGLWAVQPIVHYLYGWSMVRCFYLYMVDVLHECCKKLWCICFSRIYFVGNGGEYHTFPLLLFLLNRSTLLFYACHCKCLNISISKFVFAKLMKNWYSKALSFWTYF